MRAPKVESAAIVLVGDFNPSIFQPAWLAANKLIRDDEAKEAKIQAIVPDVSSFGAGWLNLQVTRDRFQASTLDAAHYEPMKDLVIGIFALLEHTPFKQLGINWEAHYESALEERDRIGDALGPKPHWAPVMEDPKLFSIVMGGKPIVGKGDKHQVTVQPSVVVQPGIYIHSHWNYTKDGEDASRALLDCLASDWPPLLAEARQIDQRILRIGGQ